MILYILAGLYSAFLVGVLMRYGTFKPNPSPLDYIIFIVLVVGIPFFSAYIARVKVRIK